jgi:hypothetical protein
VTEQFYVVGGRQRVARTVLDQTPQWYDYGQGVILQVDGSGSTVQSVLSYTSPPAATAPGAPVLFKSATRAGDTLYLCTQTEVMSYRLPNFTRTGWLSLPHFNDVHHVRPLGNGNLLVANTGLEMVLEITPQGQVINEWNVLGEAPWAHFAKEIDYRKGISTKPHRAHPNYLFLLDRGAGCEIWATRFEQKDAVCVNRPGLRIPLLVERVHDGLLHEGRLYFTTVNGHVIIVNAQTLAVEADIDLNQCHTEDLLLGWCRGIYVDGDLAWVGFSQIRATRFRETLSWVRVGFQRSLPTRIACYDLKQRRHLGDIPLAEQGLDTVFSILPATAEQTAL